MGLDNIYNSLYKKYYISKAHWTIMAIHEKLKLTLRIQMMSMGIALLIMMALGTVVYHFLEDWTWAQCFYFSVVTLTTVGYGDLYPTTDFSRIFTAAYIIVGVGIVAIALTTLASDYLEVSERKTLEALEKKYRGESEPEPEQSDDSK